MGSQEALGFPASVTPYRPQRLRLLGAAKRVERIGGHAGAVLGPGVVGSETFHLCGERGLAQRERVGRSADEKK